jgi:capsular polysaccharide export protein
MSAADPGQQSPTSAPGEIRAFRFNAAKRQMVRALFIDQRVHFVWLMGYRLRDYPESLQRAEAALATARRKPRSAWLGKLRLTILRLQYNATRAAFEAAPAAAAVTWNGLVSTRNIFMMAARDAGNRTLFLERGPFPGTLTADPVGVNFVNSLPRDGAPYRLWASAAPSQSGAWRPLGERLRGRVPARSTRTSSGTVAPPLSEPFVFVPLQKQGDTQLRIFGGQCRDVGATIDMLAAAADALPDGWHLRIKEHPTDRPRARKRVAALAQSRIYLDNDTETFAQVRAARAVLTVNSSVGLEAMLLEKPVIAMGQAFWALPGLAVTASTTEALRDCLGNIDGIVVDPALRDAFLSFLVAEYYPVVARDEDGRAFVDATTRTRLLDRMVQGRVL